MSDNPVQWTPRQFLVTRVKLYHYRSHAASDVALRPLTYLVGPNGSGKSAFMDALSFVADSLRTSVGEALHARDGFAEVVWRGGESKCFGIRIEFEYLGKPGHYAFTVVQRSDETHEVGTEECLVRTKSPSHSPYFRVEDARLLESSDQSDRHAGADRLHLANGAGDPVLRGVSEHVRNMCVYRLNPSAMRRIVSRDPGARLMPDGSNAASVLRAMEDRAPETKGYVVQYLTRIVPGLLSIHQKVVGNRQTVEFVQEGDGSGQELRFWAHSMSDGTLRALGVLLAAFQQGDPVGGLVGIEGANAGVNPTVAGLVAAALEDASDRRQIVVSTQNSDLLDEEDVPAESVVAVALRDGRTRIGPVDEVGQSVLREKMFTVGELMRHDQVRPDLGGAVPEMVEATLFGPTT